MPDSYSARSMPASGRTARSGASRNGFAGHHAGGLRLGGDHPLARGPHA
jgi:hypothetical protein